MMPNAEAAADVFYLYGIVPHGQSMPANASAALNTVVVPPLAALIERVDGDTFSPEKLEAKMQSIDWLETMAMKHEGVLETVMRHGPVIPARIFTLFSNHAAVADMLVRHAQRCATLLHDVRGRQEWGLQTFCDEVQLRNNVTNEIRVRPGDAPASGRGAAYLRRKAAEGRIREAASKAMDGTLQRIDADLQTLGARQCLRALRQDPAGGDNGAMLSNIAVLLEASASPRLHDAVSTWSRLYGSAGFSFKVTGPWPPYSFCELPTSPS